MRENLIAHPIFPTYLRIYDVEPEGANPLNQKLARVIDQLMGPLP